MKQGDLENLIMNVLWKHITLVNKGNVETQKELPEELDVQDIQQRLHEASPNRQWAYTTIKTVCDRVVQKGWAVRSKVGKRFMYSATLDRDEAGLAALQKICQQYYQCNIAALEQAFQSYKRRSINSTDLVILGNPKQTT